VERQGLLAKKLNRRFIGIDLNQEYIDIAKERIYGRIEAKAN
jgi:DNA modification methylase